MAVQIEPIGNQTLLSMIGNRIELTLFDVHTDRYFLSQFQITEEHKEVTHEGSD